MTLLKGNCLETLKTLPDNSIDSIVTDPPYGLEFMGKEWDAPWKNTGTVLNDPSVVGGFQDGAGGNAFSRSRIRYGFGNEASLGFQYWFTDIAIECYRVLKPGGHLLAFGGSRTYHRLASAVEDAGFEIRDQIMWIYGSGFPKSLDVSKAIDKAAGTERKDRTVVTAGKSGSHENPTRHVTNAGTPATPEAQQWQGWGTALKPAHEPIVVARKPLIGTVANNVLTYGTGALNIDGSRVGTDEMTKTTSNGVKVSENRSMSGANFEREIIGTATGRWPANVIHDGSDEVLAGFPEHKSSARKVGKITGTTFGSNTSMPDGLTGVLSYGDSGSAARFFYCAKASKSERNAGLEGFPERKSDTRSDVAAGLWAQMEAPKANFHPTVKPLALMRYLVKLVTPPNGTVLDPFLGSGSTAVAAILEGFEWIGCEMTEDYFSIIEERVAWAQKEKEGKLL